MADYSLLLSRTSRTFGLTIPLLDEPYRHQLTLAYLLFRIADTLEDAEHWTREERHRALKALRLTLTTDDPDPQTLCAKLLEEWSGRVPSQHSGYLELLGKYPALLQSIRDLPPSSRGIIVKHALRTIEGMDQFILRSSSDGSLQLESLDDLRKYCYAVAGIVGEMITELLLEGLSELQPHAKTLRQNAAIFGEALQLVNILKDASDDARFGRVYLPAEVARAEVFRLARRDLDGAFTYVETLRAAGVGHGVLPFTELPARLAAATLDRVEQQGSGAKLTRQEVARILAKVDDRIQNADQLPPGLRDYLEPLEETG